MSLQENLLAIYTAATVIQSLVLLATLVFVYRQARYAHFTLDNFRQDSRVAVYLQHRRAAQQINRLLLSDPDLSQLLGYEREELLAFMLIGDAEAMFRQKVDTSFLPTRVWQSQFHLLQKIFRLDFVTKLWEEVKREYTPDFVSFVETLTQASSGTLATPRSKAQSKTS